MRKLGCKGRAPARCARGWRRRAERARRGRTGCSRRRRQQVRLVPAAAQADLGILAPVRRRYKVCARATAGPRVAVGTGVRQAGIQRWGLRRDGAHLSASRSVFSSAHRSVYRSSAPRGGQGARWAGRTEGKSSWTLAVCATPKFSERKAGARALGPPPFWAAAGGDARARRGRPRRRERSALTRGRRCARGAAGRQGARSRVGAGEGRGVWRRNGEQCE